MTEEAQQQEEKPRYTEDISWSALIIGTAVMIFIAWVIVKVILRW